MRVTLKSERDKVLEGAEGLGVEGKATVDESDER